MGIILWIVFGALSGWIASIIMKSNQSLIADILLGIIGAMVGGFVMNLLGQPGVTGFDIYSIVVAVIGAAILIYAGRVLQRE
ncbi:MAG: Transglycosylase-associated protein [Candidatus Gottesmanbacteria bacterium GW2011_GWC2_39_8]|uniref:Transglycosylase-associated protein n=1 Tax=Candidatus Gottesmanbacteria bacterium GW2011_GWC2_39_8 TaxID=1618450 RepID=A0A0G0PUF6_9BACT|nr:MAG: Transglycosylase-associated protein [Candidatus Gottesmanbacteria bacterium GW2011_GWC2_39_8]